MALTKMVVVSDLNTTYKPCLDGRDFQTEDEVINNITKASLAGHRDKVVELAKQLVTLSERNDKAKSNEGFIQQISKYIIENTNPGDVICEHELDGSIWRDKVVRFTGEDTCSFILCRAALYRLVEAGKLKKTYKKVYEENEPSYHAKRRTVYIVL